MATNNNLLFKITILEQVSSNEACKTAEDIISIVCLPIATPTPTPTNTITPSVTPTISLTPSITPTISLTPSITPTISLTPSITPTITPTVTATVTVTPSITPTKTLTPTPTNTVTPTMSVTPTMTPTPSGPNSIQLNQANNWTYNLNNEPLVRFVPQDNTRYSVSMKILVTSTDLTSSSSIPSVSNIMAGGSLLGQVIYSASNFDNKSIILYYNGLTYTGRITNPSTNLS